MTEISIGQVAFQSNSTSGCTPLGVVISVTSPSASSITSYSWQITTPSGSILTANSPQYIAIFSQPGNYDVSLTINGNQTSVINDYISVHALPTANFNASDVTGCFPLCVDFSDLSTEGSGNIVSWAWDFGDGGASTEQSPHYCYSQVGNFTPVFSIADEFGCFADITYPGTIQVVNNFPNAAFTLSSQLDCNPPVNVNITNSSNGSSALSSSWDFGDGNTQNVNGVTAVSHAFNTTGTFDVCLTVTDQIGCQDQQCHPITVFGTANAEYSVSSSTACEGNPITFTSTTVPVPTGFQWDFNGDGIVDSNNASASYSYGNAGTYSPTLTVTYSSGCVDTQTSTNSITILDGVNVNFAGDVLQSCSFPFAVHFDNLSTGTGTIGYQWYVDGVLAGTSTNLDYVFNAYGNYDIRLVATNSLGCTNEYVLTDYVLVQEPQVSFDNSTSVCTDTNVPIFNVQVNSVDPVSFYFWDFNSDGVTDAEGLAPMFMYSAPGIYSITLTIETVSGCTASYTNTENINVLVQVDATFTSSADTTCAGQPVEFCVDNQPGNTYSWNFYDGSGWVIMPLSENCLIHDYTDTGWYDLTLTVFNGACNVLQTFQNFIYVEPPVALFEYQVVCGNYSAEFSDSSIGADHITWDFGDGSAILSDVPNPTHQYDSSGTYTVVLTAYANGSNCPDTHSVDLVVSDPDPNMFFTPSEGCPPLVSQFGCAFYYPHWDVSVSNGDHIFADWNPASSMWNISHSSSAGTQYFNYSNPDQFIWPQVTFNSGGYFDINVTVTDNNGCSASHLYDDVIHVSSSPSFASFSTTTIDACNSVNIGFEPDLSGLTSWQWVFSDGSVSTNENPFHTFNPPYNYNQPLTASLTAVDTLGCTSTVTQNINVVLPPVVNFAAASDPSCVGDLVQFINYTVGPAGTTFSWDFGDPSSAENTSTLTAPTHPFNSNGTYEVCLSANNNAGCIITNCNTNAVHIVNPAVNFTYSSTINNCLYGVQFQNTTAGTIVNSEWEFGDTQGGFGLLPVHTYPIGVYDVTLIVTNGYGCVDSLVVPDILNYGNQVGPFTELLDSANCAPFDVSFSSFNPGDTYFDYFWDFNDGSGDPAGNTVTSHTYTQPGTYCPSIIMTDPNNCPVLISCTQPIVVDEFVLDYTIPSYVCFGDTLNMTVYNGDNYQWNDMSQISQGSTTNNFLLHPFDDTEFILTGHFADCVRIDTINVEVKDLPSVGLSMTNSLCFGDSPLLLNGGTPNDLPGEYFIDGNSATYFDPTMTPEQNYNVLFQYTDSFACVNTASAQVYLHGLPVVSFPDIPDMCENADSLLLNMASPAGGIYTSGNDTIQFFNPAIGYGNYPVHYIYTDAFQCSSTALSSARVNPVPMPLIAFNDECLDVALAIQNTSSIPEGIIASANWNFGEGGTSNQFQPSPVMFLSSGSKGISLQLTSDNGCEVQLDTTVQIHAAPHAAFLATTACQNTPEIFPEFSTISSDTIIDWIWLAEGQTIHSQNTLEYSFSEWGNIPLTLIAMSNFGCDDSLTLDVYVRPAPVAEIQFEDGCFGTESQFHAITSIPIGGVISQSWDFGDGHQQESGLDVDNMYDSTGLYFIHFIAESNLGCTTSVDDSIRIYALPEVDFAIDHTQLCAANPFSLIDLSSADALSQITDWIWRMDDVVIGTTQNADVVSEHAGTYDISLEVLTDHGCRSDSTAQNAITIYPRPSAGFTTNAEVDFQNPTIEIENTSSEDVTQWYYDFGDEAVETFVEGEHLYADNGTYQITQYVWNTFGCRDTSFQVVAVNPNMLIFVPNAFTPDANGHNEIFIPSISGFDISYYQLRIFDRWGIEVFSTTDPKEGWDGRFKGVVAEDGNYSWSMDIRNGKEVTIRRQFGNVILLK